VKFYLLAERSDEYPSQVFPYGIVVAASVEEACGKLGIRVLATGLQSLRHDGRPEWHVSVDTHAESRSFHTDGGAYGGEVGGFVLREMPELSSLPANLERIEALKIDQNAP
jgi:hypothetical protein